MSHDYHEGLEGYHPDAILQDGCDECEHRSRSGLGGVLMLDSENLDRLWRAMLVSERLDYNGEEGAYRSFCDQRLGRNLYLMGVLDERSNMIDGWNPNRFLPAPRQADSIDSGRARA